MSERKRIVSFSRRGVGRPRQEFSFEDMKAESIERRLLLAIQNGDEAGTLKEIRQLCGLAEGAFRQGLAAGAARSKHNYADRLDEIEEESLTRVGEFLEDLQLEAIGAMAFKPAGLFVYTLWADDQTVLYVGKSTSILSRLATHWNDMAKRSSIDRISVIRCPDKTKMDELEHALIHKHDPPWNLRMRPKTCV